MSLTKMFDKAKKKMSIHDFQIVKILVILFTLMILAAWPGFRECALSVAWYWYLLFMIVLLIPLCKKLFK